MNGSEVIRVSIVMSFEHDQLKEKLMADGDGRPHPMISRVDHWESKPIERIKQVADGVRCQLQEILCQSKKDVERSLRPITNELREIRRMEDYTEIDLKRWMGQLNQLKEQLEKPPMVEMMRENEMSSTHIPLIEVRIVKRTKGK